MRKTVSEFDSWGRPIHKNIAPKLPVSAVVDHRNNTTRVPGIKKKPCLAGNTRALECYHRKTWVFCVQYDASWGDNHFARRAIKKKSKTGVDKFNIISLATPTET